MAHLETKKGITLSLGIPDNCRNFKAWEDILARGHDMAVLDLTRYLSYNDYLKRGMNSTAGNRMRYAEKKGYYTSVLPIHGKNEYLDDIHEVNNSSLVRQGREMAAHYQQYPSQTGKDSACMQHNNAFIGVLYPENQLFGYIVANFAGEMAASSQILGHADHLSKGIMLKLWASFIEVCFLRGTKYVIYSRWSDGGEGLKYWKYSVGMRPEKIILK